MSNATALNALAPATTSPNEVHRSSRSERRSDTQRSRDSRDIHHDREPRRTGDDQTRHTDESRSQRHDRSQRSEQVRDAEAASRSDDLSAAQGEHGDSTAEASEFASVLATSQPVTTPLPTTDAIEESTLLQATNSTAPQLALVEPTNPGALLHYSGFAAAPEQNSQRMTPQIALPGANDAGTAEAVPAPVVPDGLVSNNGTQVALAGPTSSAPAAASSLATQGVQQNGNTTSGPAPSASSITQLTTSNMTTEQAPQNTGQHLGGNTGQQTGQGQQGMNSSGNTMTAMTASGDGAFSVNLQQFQPTAAATAASNVEAPDPVARALGRQVAQAINQGWQQEMPLVVRLTPPELGTLRITIQDGPNGVSIKIAAEDENLNKTLEKALPTLRQEVKSDQGTVQISMESRESGEDPRQQQQMQQQHQQPSDQTHGQEQSSSENASHFANILNGDAIEDDALAPAPPPAADASHDGLVSQLA
jgi:flagellar hook-length control protein FliK